MAGHQFYAEWSEADGEFVGRVNEYPSLSWLDPNVIVALQGIRDLVAEVEADMEVERQKALEYGYARLAREKCTADIEGVRRAREIMKPRRQTETEQQAERELRQAAAGYNPSSNSGYPLYRIGAQKWAGGVHGAKSKRFSRQDYWVFIGIAVVIAWILIGPVF